MKRPIAQHYRDGWLIGWATSNEEPFTARFFTMAPPEAGVRAGAWTDLPGRFATKEAADDAAIDAAKRAVDREIG